MPNYYSGNYFLNLEQMKTNAIFIYNWLGSREWTLNAICGLLGNTEVESTHNPGIWQDLTIGTGGYSLVQWTPASKYRNWCVNNGLQPARMESALSRIIWEVENNEQWVTHSSYPLTFFEFTQSEDSPYELAMTFLHNYEMPENLNQPERGENAEYWYEFLSGEEPPKPPPDTDLYLYRRSRILPIILGNHINRRRLHG